MSFLVEDGSGTKGASSYASVAGFQTYHTDRGNDHSALDSDAIQELLIVATDYIDTRWGSRFLGIREFPSYLDSRVLFTLTDTNASDGDELIIAGVTHTFRTTPTLDNEIEIGDTIAETLANVPAGLDFDELVGTKLAEPDITALTIYVTVDGLSASTDVTNATVTATSAGKSGRRQSLEFPRTNLRDWSGELVFGVPPQVQEATYEYAWRANTAALAPDPTVDATGLRLTGSRTKVGPIETEVTYAEEQTPQITTPYPAADRLLKEFIRTGGVIRN